VVFAGGGGLLLLMQPDSNHAAVKALNRIFIVTSLNHSIFRFRDLFSIQNRFVRQRPIAQRAVVTCPTGPPGAHRPYTVLSTRRYWIYGRTVAE
jgi:hypothetical protein